ncbi:hypothetical protein COV19_00875 [Candidatus Woesearchaeota archaeon CG10_big_fil_rev_8_21_14_0_10_44_13]|nr:MAG: hypothetical protein COV19_00875 [Candidatus Woesearchaeota archaeon CG10_big_fil_rev_8_21_14_0_10_44_13]
MKKEDIKNIGKMAAAYCAKAAFFLLMLCFISLFIPHDARADTTTKISGYYYTDETFVLNDRLAIINVDSDDQIIINYDGEFLVIKNNTCKTVINNKFCVDSILHDKTLDKKKAQIIVYYIGPDITISRSINKSDPFIGEGIKMTVKLENNGNITAKNVTYMDMFPPEIEITKIKKGNAVIEKVQMIGNETGTKQNMTRVFWKGEIAMNGVIDLVYTIKPLQYINTLFAAKAIYNDGRKNVEVISSTSSIKTKSFFEISKKFAPTDYSVAAESTTLISGETKADLYIGEEALFIVEIKNKALKNETINVSYLDFYIPENLLYKGSTTFVVYTNKSNENETYNPGAHTLEKIGAGRYRWHGLMNPDGLVFAIKLKGVKKGHASIAVYAKLVQLDEKKEPYYRSLYDQDYYDNEDIEVKLKDPSIETNLNEGKTFDSAQKAYLTIYMINPNEFANLTKMKVILDTPWTSKNFTINDLRKGNYVSIFDGFVTMPSVTESTGKKIKVNVTYETEYGELYSLKLDRNIAIKPFPPIKITYSVSPAKSSTTDKSIIDYQKSIVTVRLSNTGNSRIEHINVTQISDPLLTNQDNISRTINLEKGVVMDVLMYEIEPPDDKDIKEYLLSTNIDYMASNETFHAVRDYVIEVNPKKLSITGTKKAQVETAVRGVPFKTDYIIENTEEETLYNVTVLFPEREDYDLLGSRHYSIKKIDKDERIPIIGKERVVSKINLSSARLPKAEIVFHDVDGVEFKANSSDTTIEILYAPFDSPTMTLRRNISKDTVNESESFLVDTMIMNIGQKDARVTLTDFGKSWEIYSYAGTNKTMTYLVNESRLGDIELQPAVISYGYNDETYYSFSNKNILTVKEKPGAGKAEEKPVEEAVQEVKQEVVEKKANPYAKYLYLVVFVIIVCLIIFSVIRMKPSEKRFEFMEE